MKTIDVSNLTQDQLDGYFVLSAKQDDGLTSFWLEAGASINNNEEALQYAIKNDNEDLVDKLLKLNVDVNTDVEGKPLWFYSLYDMKYFYKFLEFNIDVNAKDADGMTALEIAYLRNDEKLADKLIEIGIDVNEIMSKDMPLITFIMLDYYTWDAVVKVKWFDKLINAGADINKILSWKYGYPIIYWLFMPENDDIIDKALEAGIDVNAVASPDDRNALMIFAGNEGIVEKLIRYGADVNAQDIYGHTVLLYSMMANCNRSYMKLLLENGADPSIADKSGMTPLKMARRDRDREKIKLIKKYLKK